MEKYIDVPISVGKEIAEKFNKNQVIIVCWDDEHKRTHITTYGKSQKECEDAAKGGNFIKKALGWSDKLCHAKTKEKEPND